MIRIKIIICCCVIILLILALLYSLSLKGRNIIADSSYYAREFADNCSNTVYWRTCYSNHLSSLMQRGDIDIILSIIDKLQSLDKKTRECHIIAHSISSTYVEKNLSKWKELLKKVDISDCNDGFAHGIFEGLSRYDSSFKITVSNIPKICQEIKEIKGAKNTSQTCAHIMGHLLLAANCSDASFENTLRKTVEECTSLPSSLRVGCYEGVFMESIMRENLQHQCGYDKLTFNEASARKQEEICNSYNGKAGTACWQQISDLYIGVFPDNPKMIFEACQNAPSSENAIACQMRVAEQEILFKENLDKDFSSMCNFLVDTEFHEQCIRNALISLVHASYKFTDKGISFCQSFNSKFNHLCLTALKEAIIKEVPISKRLLACQQLPEPYQSQCVTN